MAVTPVQRKKYFEARSAGFSIVESARKAKFSEATAYRVEKAAQSLRADEGIDSSASNYRELKKEEMDRIALIAPRVSINIIRDYKVFAKGGVERPKFLLGVVRCPNPGCITNAHEPVSSRFEVLPNGLHCMYCDWLITNDITGHMI